MKIDVAVVGKIICKTIVPPMAITEKDKFGLIAKWDDFCLGVRSIESILGRHGINFNKYPKNVQKSIKNTLTKSKGHFL